MIDEKLMINEETSFYNVDDENNPIVSRPGIIPISIGSNVVFNISDGAKWAVQRVDLTIPASNLEMVHQRVYLEEHFN